MTAEEFVKSKTPNAKAEKHTSGIIGDAQSTYWLIRDGRNTMYFASGKTKSKAWMKAKKRILEIENKK